MKKSFVQGVAISLISLSAFACGGRTPMPVDKQDPISGPSTANHSQSFLVFLSNRPTASAALNSGQTRICLRGMMMPFMEAKGRDHVLQEPFLRMEQDFALKMSRSGDEERR